MFPLPRIEQENHVAWSEVLVGVPEGLTGPGKILRIGAQHQPVTSTTTSSGKSAAGVNRGSARASSACKSLIRPVPDRPGHDKRYAIDCSKLKGLGWRAAAGSPPR